MSAGPSEIDVRDALDRVDWNFPQSSTPLRSAHSLHWFPGNFIPQIPAFLIQILSRKDELVVDPFCGSGTTGVEAMRLGRRTRLSDINRASIQVTTGKVAVVSDCDIREEIESLSDRLLWNFIPSAEPESCDPFGSAPELKFWLHPQTLSELRYLWVLIGSVVSKSARAALELLFTDLLFHCASAGVAKTRTGKRRRHHWGWVADNVRPKELVAHNAIGLFRERLSRVQTLIAENLNLGDATEVAIVREDIRMLSVEDGAADLVVTSPPYLGMIDYALANRLTYLWMGWPIEDDLGQEIGARRYRKRPTAVADYLAAMEGAARQIERILKPRHFCALVIGASRKYPEAVEEVVRIFSGKLRLFWGPKLRVPSRQRVSERLGSKSVEYLIVFQK